MRLGTREFWNRFTDSLIMRIIEKAGIPLLILITGVVLATGRSMVEGVWDRKVEATMKPRLEVSEKRTDTLAWELLEVKKDLRSIRNSQREFFGAQMDLDPRFRMAVKERVIRKREARQQKRETEEVLNDLLESGE